MLEAFRTNLTYTANRLEPLESDCSEITKDNSGTATTKSITGRANAKRFVLGKRKILNCEHIGGCFVQFLPLFSVALLIPFFGDVRAERALTPHVFLRYAFCFSFTA